MADYVGAINPPQPGQLIEGEILEIGRSGILIELPAYGKGWILGREIKDNPQLVKTLKAGDLINVVVLDSENDNGLIELSFNRAQTEKGWQYLQEKRSAGEEISVNVRQANRGGLLIEASGIAGFLPVSQLKEEHYPKVEGGDKSKILQELGKFVGQALTVKILDINPREQKLIVSEKALSKEDVQKIKDIFKIGEIIDGEVSGLVDFGAFVKFGDPAIEGLVHISEIDWQIISRPSDVLKVGDKVQAKVIDVSSNGQISLSIKALKKDPWENVEKAIKKGDEIDGVVVKFNPYGAFIKINEDIQGLAHISEFEDKEKMNEALKIGQTYKFSVAYIDSKEHRLSLKLVK